MILRRRPNAAISATVVAASVSFGTITPASAAFEMPALAGSEAFPGYPRPIAHAGAPVPQPFGPEYLGGYVSDISSHEYGIYYGVIDSFNQVRGAHPELMSKNLDLAVEANHRASGNQTLIARAQHDAAADKEGVLESISDAFGAQLGKHFLDALRENRLPKTEFLMGNGYAARAGGLASSTWFEKEIFGYQRPFVVAPQRIQRYDDGVHDFYGTTKSFPSGHTNQATWITTLLAVMLPELAPQLLARGSESGYNRMVMGVHYPLDVIGGRMTGTAAAADRWNDPKMRDALLQAGQEIRRELEWRTGKPLGEAVASDSAYRSTADSVAEYTQRMNYGFAPIGRTDAPMVVPQAAPDLLLGAHPTLTYAQRAEVLRQTAVPSGSPLDDQGPRGSWQRLNLAAAMAARVTVNADGSVSVAR